MHSPLNPSPTAPLVAVGRLRYRQPYEGVPESVPAVRERFASAAKASGLDADTADAALLCLSELATNAVVHAGRRFIVTVSVHGSRQPVMRLAVHDPVSARLAFPEKPDVLDVFDDEPSEATSGRGMAIVATLADRTGVDLAVDGKAVWCELRLARPGNLPAPR